MITLDGFATTAENPSMGPPVYSMVRFGAKESALIVKRKEWWRIITPTMLHAGIIHIVPNIAIQVSFTHTLLICCLNAFIWCFHFSYA